MVLMAVADRPCPMPSSAMMSRMVQELPVFADFHPAEHRPRDRDLPRPAGREDGLDRAMALIRDALPQRLRETAYLLACEVAAADGEASQAELQFLQDLRIALDLDRLIAAGRAGGEGALPGDLSAGPPQPTSSALP